MPEYSFGGSPQTPESDQTTNVDFPLDAFLSHEQMSQQKKYDAMDAAVDTAAILRKLDEKLDREIQQRESADAEAMSYAIRWNKINLGVGITGIVLGVVAIVVDIVLAVLIR